GPEAIASALERQPALAATAARRPRPAGCTLRAEPSTLPRPSMSSCAFPSIFECLSTAARSRCKLCPTSLRRRDRLLGRPAPERRDTPLLVRLAWMSHL